MRTGLLGLGVIGQEVVRLAEREAPGQCLFVGAVVRDPTKARSGITIPTMTTLDALLAERPEVVVECAGHGGLQAHGAAVLRAGVDLIMVSVGIFAAPGVLDDLLAAAEAGGAQAKIASGAIGALDAISAAAVQGLSRVTHTTRKPPRTLLSPEEAASLIEAKEVFRGSAREGALLFPESINVCAAVSLAGIGLDRTEVRVLADPSVDRNHHTVEAEGGFGFLRFEIANIPTEANPRTGRLVAMSIVRNLLLRRAPLVVG
jgi:aspartate dehydrogenase